MAEAKEEKDKVKLGRVERRQARPAPSAPHQPAPASAAPPDMAPAKAPKTRKAAAKPGAAAKPAAPAEAAPRTRAQPKSKRTTVSDAEIEQFSALAESWWDPAGPFKPLHRFNPVRLAYLRDRLITHFGRDAAAVAPFAGLKLLDIGCGGGLLAEPLARMGFSVTAIDAGLKSIGVAAAHARKSGLSIDYRVAAPEDLSGEQFDVVLSMEVIEHVADPATFLAACCGLVRPNGAIFAATLNRTVKAYVLAIIGAEYLLRWMPRGTHDWKKFVKPSELSGGLRANGVAVREIKGFSYNPLKDEWFVSGDLFVNYVIFGMKE